MKQVHRERPRPDPLIDEVRAIRQAISDAHGNDVLRLGKHLQEIQGRWSDRIVRRSSTARSTP